MEHKIEKFKYEDLIDLVGLIANDPKYQDRRKELGEIITILANYVKIVHEVKQGREYLERRRQTLNSALLVKPVTQVLRG